MSGILDNKTRILDAVVTVEGRRQIAEGTFVVTYASFSDAEVVYRKDDIEGHEDPSERIYLETPGSLQQDQIIFEANDDGNLVALRDQSIDINRVDSMFPKNLAASFSNGKVLAQQLNFGANVKVSTSIPSQLYKKIGVGFSYTDSKNHSASVYLSASYAAGTASIDYTNNKIFVGIQGGIAAQELTTKIQEQIELLSSVGTTGPKVQAVDRLNNLYILDISGSHEKIVTKFLTGSSADGKPFADSFNPIYSPFIIQEAVLGGRTDIFDISQNADFASQITGILTASFDNFKNLNIISTVDSIFKEDKFTLSENEVLFDAKRIEEKAWVAVNQVPSLNAVDSIFNDDKLSNLINFKYLPPVAKTKQSDFQGTVLGNYPPFGANISPLSYTKILDQLKNYESKTITFSETSRQNSLLCQLFEVSSGKTSKLDIVEYGNVRNDPYDPSIVSEKIYFVGKTFLDNRGTTCFINMFTLIFSRLDGSAESAGEEL